jgi:hypothetical protein
MHAVSQPCHCVSYLFYLIIHIRDIISHTSSCRFTLDLACKPNTDRKSCNQLLMDFLHKWVANGKIKSVGWQLIFHLHLEVGFLSSGYVTYVQYVRPWKEQSVMSACGLHATSMLLSRTEHLRICSVQHITSKVSMP